MENNTQKAYKSVLLNSHVFKKTCNEDIKVLTVQFIILTGKESTNGVKTIDSYKIKAISSNTTRDQTCATFTSIKVKLRYLSLLCLSL